MSEDLGRWLRALEQLPPDLELDPDDGLTLVADGTVLHRPVDGGRLAAKYSGGVLVSEAFFPDDDTAGE